MRYPVFFTFHFVLRLVTVKILIRLAPNLARRYFILTLIRNLFETILENKMEPSKTQ